MSKQKKNAFQDIRQKKEEEMAALQPPPAPPEAELRFKRRKAVKDQFSPMVTEVLTELRDALMRPRATIKEGISNDDGSGFWDLKESYSQHHVGGSSGGSSEALAEVLLVFDKEDRPLHFLCIRFRILFDKRKKAGLSREELVAALHDLFAK